jgi:hypothetical protein
MVPTRGDSKDLAVKFAAAHHHGILVSELGARPKVAPGQ